MTGLFFDLLTNASAPYGGFGEPLLDSSEALKTFKSLTDRAHSRLAAGFGYDPSDPGRAAQQLDEIVRRMWAEGWSPKSRKIELFAQDFGLAFAAGVLDAVGGTPVFRDAEQLTHFSLWWQQHRVEAFPFHCVIKCLLESDGSSMQYFFRSLSSQVR